MKLSEITQQELTVVTSDAKSTTLEDPKTKVKTIVPKDPNKPGMIKQDGQDLVFDKQVSGEVSGNVTPGQKVKVKSSNETT